MSDNCQQYISFVEDVMLREHIAGVAVAMAERGQVMFEQEFGYRDIKHQLPVTPDTIFGVASAGYTGVLKREGIVSSA